MVGELLICIAMLADFDSGDVLPGSELEAMMSELRTLEAGGRKGRTDFQIA